MNKKFLICIILFLLFIPAIETFSRFVPEQYIIGYETLWSCPKFTCTSWFNGSFQVQFDRWYQQHIGFRNDLIKTYDQIEFSLFHETDSTSQYILGKDNYLYEAIYLNSFNNLDKVTLYKLKNSVIQIKYLQEQLQKRGITLLLAITPSKATVYPEFIPDQYIIKAKTMEQNNYQQLVFLLKTYKVNYIDGHALMVRLKQYSPYPPFVQGGTHWDYYGACEFNRAMLNKIAQLTSFSMNTLDCMPVQVDGNATGTDHDLIDLINIWQPQDIGGVIPHPTVSTSKVDNAMQPSILLVGSSFFITLQDVLRHQPIFSRREFFHYYDTIMDNDTDIDRPLNKAQINWSTDIFSFKVIVVEANEARLNPLYSSDRESEIGYGFVEDALQHL